MRAGMLIVMTGAMAAGACGGPSPDQEPPVRACTMIGCESGLTVRFADDLGELRSVEVSGPGETPETRTCSANRPCDDGVFFRDFLADVVTIRVTTDAGTTERTATPTYRTAQPNGEGCPPTCRQGEVLVAGSSPAAGSPAGSSSAP